MNKQSLRDDEFASELINFLYNETDEECNRRNRRMKDSGWYETSSYKDNLKVRLKNFFSSNKY